MSRHALIKVDPPRDTPENEPEHVPNHGVVVAFFVDYDAVCAEIHAMNARNEEGLHLWVDAVPEGVALGAHVCLDDCRGPETSA